MRGLRNRLLAPRLHVLGGYIFLSVVAAAISIWHIWNTRQTALNSLSQLLESYSEITEEAYLAKFDRLELAIDAMTFGVETLPSSRKAAELKNRAEHFGSLLSDIDGLEFNFIDGKGHIVSSTMDVEAAKKIDFSQRDWYRYSLSHPNENTIVSEPMVGQLRPELIFLFIRVVRSPSGEPTLFVATSIPANYFSKFRQAAKLDALTLFSVTTGQSAKYLYRFPNQEKTIGKTLPESAASQFRAGTHRVTQKKYSEIDGVQRLIVISRIGPFPITIAVGEDIDRYLSPWRASSIRFMTALILLELAGFLVLAYLLKRQETLHDLERAVSQSSKMVSLGEMSAGVAHEINNPLAIILGTLAILKSIGPEKLDAKIESMTRAAVRIERLVKNLRQVSRTSDDRKPLKTEALGQILEESVALARGRAKQFGVELRTDLEPQLNVDCDLIEIEQVMINLLNNAIDAIKDQPQKWVRVQAYHEDSHVVIRVTDSGPGIPKAIQAKLFDPFFTTKGVGEGTGLGLSITKGIIESHGGSIEIDAKLANTCFVIQMPKSKSSSSSGSIAA